MTTPILLNDSQPAQSQAEVLFLLQNVLKRTDIPASLLEIALRIWKENATLTHNELLRLVRKAYAETAPTKSEPKKASLREKWFGTTTQQETKTDHAWVDKRFSRHFQESKSASLAYASHEKPVPSAVWWPDPTAPGARAASTFETRPVVRTWPIINKGTPIGSAGSCFAMEIAHWLQNNGFNYLITEQPKPHDPHTLPISNARWGIIFNAPSLRQLVERAFGVIQTPRVVWSDVREGREQFFDPFREDVVYHSLEDYENDYDVHVAATRAALSQTKVFAMTLGMNEVWFLKSSGHALSRAPWRVASTCVEQRVMTVEENVAHLEAMWSTWKKFNPDIQLILTVSPVPLHATFRGDTHHVIVANCHSKSLLRVAAEQFCASHPDVHYFPAYEVVLHCTKEAWGADQRHVSRQAVENVMRTFCEMFVAPADVPESIRARNQSPLTA